MDTLNILLLLASFSYNVFGSLAQAQQFIFEDQQQHYDNGGWGGTKYHVVHQQNLHPQSNPVLPSSYGTESYTQNKELFRIINEWKYLDFEYPTYTRRQQAIASREFIPENNLPLGIDVFRNRLFISTPRWKDGVPASFGYLPFPPKESSPAIHPYPDWSSHGDPYNPVCSKLISVYRSSIDQCGRIWLIDSGIVNATVSLNQVCPPKIVAYELEGDTQIINYELPSDQVKQDSLHSNILVEVNNGQCNDAYVYVTDVWRFGLIVYSLAKNRSWRITNYQFSPNPIASDFNLYGLNFQWLDGIFGMSLSLEHPAQERILFFHPMASFKEFMVATALLHNELLWSNGAQNVSKLFREVGDRGINGQSSTSGIDRNGVMFYTQVHKDDIGCWDTRKPYVRNNLALLNSKDSKLIQFPNDLKLDSENEQGLWVISNSLPIYLYSQLNYNEINFRILRADARNAVKGTVCDPLVDEKTSISTSVNQWSLR